MPFRACKAVSSCGDKGRNVDTRGEEPHRWISHFFLVQLSLVPLRRYLLCNRTYLVQRQWLGLPLQQQLMETPVQHLENETGYSSVYKPPEEQGQVGLGWVENGHCVEHFYLRWRKGEKSHNMVSAADFMILLSKLGR